MHAPPASETTPTSDRAPMNETIFTTLQAATMLIVIGLVASICLRDLSDRRIPNRLVLAGFATALLYHAAMPVGDGLFDRPMPGALGLGAALGGAAIAFGCFLVLHAMRVMGAGDVKMMGFAGAVFGAPLAFDLIVLVLLSGGLLSLVRMIDGERRRRTLANLRRILAVRLLAGARHLPGPKPAAGEAGAAGFDPRTDTADRLPYAIAIGTAFLLLAAARHYAIALPWSLR